VEHLDLIQREAQRGERVCFSKLASAL
jgi:hypothetical protein